MISLFLLVIIACYAIFLVKQWRCKTAIRRWRNALNIKKHVAVFQQLYANTNGFALSQQARLKHDAIEYIYGEIEFEPFIALLSLCKPNESTVFYDLGSGTGKAVIACAMVFNVKKCCGIELFTTLHQSAQQQRQRLQAMPDYHKNALQIEFINDNFLKAQLSDGSLFFINATVFLGETWLAISKFMEQIQTGSLVLSSSKALASALFVIVHTTQVPMSWGLVDVFIQRRC